MQKFIGKIVGEPEHRDGRWYFSIWNTKANKGINCISSARFEAENRNVQFEIKTHDEVEVIGEVQMPGTCFFDYVNILEQV